MWCHLSAACLLTWHPQHISWLQQQHRSGQSPTCGGHARHPAVSSLGPERDTAPVARPAGQVQDNRHGQVSAWTWAGQSHSTHTGCMQWQCCPNLLSIIIMLSKSLLHVADQAGRCRTEPTQLMRNHDPATQLRMPCHAAHVSCTHTWATFRPVGKPYRCFCMAATAGGTCRLNFSRWLRSNQWTR